MQIPIYESAMIKLLIPLVCCPVPRKNLTIDEMGKLWVFSEVFPDLLIIHCHHSLLPVLWTASFKVFLSSRQPCTLSLLQCSVKQRSAAWQTFFPHLFCLLLSRGCFRCLFCHNYFFFLYTNEWAKTRLAVLKPEKAVGLSHRAKPSSLPGSLCWFGDNRKKSRTRMLGPRSSGDTCLHIMFLTLPLKAESIQWQGLKWR